jgi:predicted DNA-binding transcriptional regulator AlpA
MFAHAFDTCQDDVRHNETMSDWLPIDEATRRYGVSRATLYRLIAEGRVQHGRRAGDRRAFVSSADIKEVTTIRPIVPKLQKAPAAKRRPRRTA